MGRPLTVGLVWPMIVRVPGVSLQRNAEMALTRQHPVHAPRPGPSVPSGGERSLPMAEIRRTPPARAPGSCPQARPRPSGRETMHLASQAPRPGNGTDQPAVRAQTTITPSCSVTPSMTRDDNRENDSVRSSMSHPVDHDTCDSSRQSMTRCYHRKRARAVIFTLLHQVSKSTVLYRYGG
jgi:hypothetical protein